jgi:hypothetical protein
MLAAGLRRMRSAGLRLSDRPPRGLHRRDWPRRGAWSRRPRQCPAKLLAMILLGGASETYRGGMGAFQEQRQVLIRLAVLQIRTWHRERPAHPLLRRDGNPERDP